MNCPLRLPVDKSKRPSHKRQCFQPKGDSLDKPKVLVRDTQAMVGGKTEGNISNDDFDGHSTQDAMESLEKLKLAKCASTRNIFHASKLSPPSQSYDASLAIENAVNHLNLADQDTTYLSVSHSTQQVDSERPVAVRTLSTATMVAKHISRRYLMNKAGGGSTTVPQTYHHHHQPNWAVRHADRRTVTRHKPTCRHYHNLPVMKQTDNQSQSLSTNQLDDTGEDLTLPSDFLQSDATICRTNAICDEKHQLQQQPHAKQMHQTDQTAGRHLPSIGGSPTALQTPSDNDDGQDDKSECVFKRPHVQPSRRTLTPANCSRVAATTTNRATTTTTNNNTCRLVVQANCSELVGIREHSCSRLGTLPSTPEGFWNIDIGGTQEVSDAGDNYNDPENRGVSATGQRSLYRRRRPLTFPKRHSRRTSPPN